MCTKNKLQASRIKKGFFAKIIDYFIKNEEYWYSFMAGVLVGGVMMLYLQTGGQ